MNYWTSIHRTSHTLGDEVNTGTALVKGKALGDYIVMNTVLNVV